MFVKLEPDRNKINAKFEGYKLKDFPEDASMVRFPLPEVRPCAQRLGNTHRMGFRELQARVRFSHLAYGFPLDNDKLGTGFYVDEAYNVVAVLFDTVNRKIRFNPIAPLSRPSSVIPSYTEPDCTVPTDPQYPSIIALSHNLLLAANGHGDIAVVGFELKEGELEGTVLSTVRYEGDGSEGVSPVPCALLAAKLIVHTRKIVMVVHSRVASKQTKFNIATLEMDVPSASNVGDHGIAPAHLETLHIQQGSEVPVYCAITHHGDKCIFGSEARYQHVSGPSETTSPPGQQASHAESDVSKEPPSPYQWSQDSTDLAVHWMLPKGTPKSAISCTFASQHLSLKVDSADHNLVFASCKLWGPVKPDECTWTIEPTTGLLSLYLAKYDERTRWPHLLEVDDNVLETLDNSERSEIAERLEKFTSDIDDPAGAGAHSQRAALHPAATDMDEDVDEEGQPVVFTVYDHAGKALQEISSGDQEWICSSFYHPSELPTVCVKHDVDGLVYSLTDTNGSPSIAANHVASLNAFAFVRASKRDSRFLNHDRKNQFAVIVESSRNAYIYYHSKDEALREPQTLLDLTQGHDTDVLGVQLILNRVLMILTESEIIVCSL